MLRRWCWWGREAHRAGGGQSAWLGEASHKLTGQPGLVLGAHAHRQGEAHVGKAGYCS